MREIKFRAFCPITKEIKYFDFQTLHDKYDEFYSIHDVFVTSLKVMQYTGLKDKNNKEIYEGDICTIWMGVKQNNPYIVEDLRELYSDMNHADSYYRITNIEVIGNIYENPELLDASLNTLNRT